MQFSFKKHLFFSANSSKINLFELFSFISIGREVEMVWKMEITGEMERVETEIAEGKKRYKDKKWKVEGNIGIPLSKGHADQI
jgi:hypothetical protein